LVYEVDPDKEVKANVKDNPDLLASSLKRRIDPADLYNVTIRPVGTSRVEIILPTGGKHQSEAEEQVWNKLLAEAREKYPPPSGKTLDVGRGRVQDLIAAIYEQHPEATVTEIDKFVDEHYKTERLHLTGEEIQKVKELIASVGSLEFRILANSRDDREAIAAASKYLEDAQKDSKIKSQLDFLALRGKPPPPPTPPTPEGFPVEVRGYKGHFTYKWVELGRQERYALHLNNAEEKKEGETLWQQAARAREKGVTFPMGDNLLWSRPVSNPSRLPLKD